MEVVLASVELGSCGSFQSYWVVKSSQRCVGKEGKNGLGGLCANRQTVTFTETGETREHWHGEGARRVEGGERT